jgi:hypothetical protein
MRAYQWFCWICLVVAGVVGASPLQAQSRCGDVFPDRASFWITENLAPSRTLYDVDNLLAEQVRDLVGQPIRMPHTVQGEPSQMVGPVVVHPLTSFTGRQQRVIRSLLTRSLRPSWTERGGRLQLENSLSDLAVKLNLTVAQVRDVDRQDESLYAEMQASDQVLVEYTGVEVGKVLVEFRDGQQIESQPMTSYLVRKILEDDLQVIGTFLENLPPRPIARIQFFHTHPHLNPGSAASLSRADIQTLWEIRSMLSQYRTPLEIAEMDFHMFAIGRLESSILVGQYSERGWGSL